MQLLEDAGKLQLAVALKIFSHRVRTILGRLYANNGKVPNFSRQSGVMVENIKRRMKIVFVCTGNTCRSPMAQIVFKKLLAEKIGCPINELENKGYEILSGGLAASDGMTASANATLVVQKLGVSLEDHQSRYVNLDLLQHADAVLVMTKNHLDTIKNRFHDQKLPVQLLSFSGADISDPFGGDEITYSRCLAEIQENLQHLVFKLLS